MVTDIPDSGRIAYVGIDNEKAGRTAGFLTARMTRRTGPVVVLTGNLGMRAHAERLAGFRAGLLHEEPKAHIAAVLEGFDEDDRVARLLTRAFRENPNTAAIYNSGGCLTVVATALRKFLDPAGTVFIGHELNAESRILLEQGVMTLTIDQAVELQARRAVEVLLHHVGHVATPLRSRHHPVHAAHARQRLTSGAHRGTDPWRRRDAAARTDGPTWVFNPCAAGLGRFAPR